MISVNEAKDIIISVIVISLALSIANSGLGIVFTPAKLAFMISLFAITVGSGFVVHELAHKFTAIKFGGCAEFKLWVQGLLLALVFSLFGFVFVAPGAVYIYTPKINKTQNGLIALAGPAANLALSFLFLAFALIFPLSIGKIDVWQFASKINIWLGMFNLIPIFPLDGSKIMDWNLLVWIFSVGVFGFFFLHT